MRYTDRPIITDTNNPKHVPALEDLEVQASKSMMQKHLLNTKPAILHAEQKCQTSTFHTRNSGLQNMDLLNMHNKDSPALNFCFFWFKPKEDAPPARGEKKL